MKATEYRYQKAALLRHTRDYYRYRNSDCIAATYYRQLRSRLLILHEAGEVEHITLTEITIS